MHDVLFAEAIPFAFKRELEQRMFYISDSIEDFRLIMGSRGVDGVSVKLTAHNGSIATEVAAKILAAGEGYRNRRRPKTPARVWQNECGPAYEENTFELMSQRGLALQMGSGLVAIGEAVMALTDYFDVQLCALVKDMFSAHEYRYPTLITSEVMHRSGCLKSFPHLLFIAQLHSNVDAETVERQVANGNYDNHCRAVELCLPPTMCYHVYQQFSDATFSTKPGLAVTAKGKAFRFESRYEKNLERLWDFTIREVVFIGTMRFVATERQRLMTAVCSLMERWQLTGFCETASDPFFTAEDSSFVQRLMALKYELRLNIDPHTSLAAASFNLHNDFFGRAFNIRYPDGQSVRTACAGFGLERLAFAFFCQHGLKQTGWPEVVRDGVAKLGGTAC